MYIGWGGKHLQIRWQQANVLRYKIVGPVGGQEKGGEVSMDLDQRKR